MELSPGGRRRRAGERAARRGHRRDAAGHAAQAIDRPDGTLRRAPAFCAGLPACQTSTQAAGGQLRHRRHRLPHHGAGRRRPDPQLHPDGRRGRALRRPGTRSPTRSTPSPIWATARTSTPASWRSARRSPRKARITYKLLFNDAVAMTGGQPAEGAPTVPRIAAQLAAEGVQRIAVVADAADRLPRARDLPPGTTPPHARAPGRRAAGAARLRRRVGADLRPGLRHGKAPPPQARHAWRSRTATW